MQAPSTLSARSRSLAWLLLLVAVCAGTYWWWWVGQPVALPDAPSSRIACVSYAPFREPGESPLDLKAFVTPERIDADLRVLSQRFDCVRTYSQSHGLAAVPGIAQRYHMKVLMGIWLSREHPMNAVEMKMGIATAQAYPQVIRGVIVGNEVLLRGELSPADLADHIRQVRAAIPAGIPVTYADVWEDWLRYPQMAKSVDYITVHILPFWEDHPVPAEHAVEHVANVYARMQKEFPGKTLMVGETGWPSAGRVRQGSEPSLVNEARYLREFLRFAATVDMPYNVIETFDQPWKRVLEGTVGGFWGIYDVNARPKFSMQGPVIEETHWLDGWYAGAFGMVLFALVGNWRRVWRGTSGWAATLLMGLGAGVATAWQVRQMHFAAALPWEWVISVAMIALALLSGLFLSRTIATRFTGIREVAAPPTRLRFGWLFVLVFYDLLLAFDGRYRDFTVGLFAIPAVAYAVLALLERETVTPSVEQRFLAVGGVLLSVVVVIEELGENRVAWLWLGLNLLLCVPVLFAWRGGTVRLQPNQ